MLSRADQIETDKVGDRRAQQVGFVVADRVARVFEDAQSRTLDDAMDFLGKFRRADPVVATAENERRRDDGGKLGAQIEAAPKSAWAKRFGDRFRRKDRAAAAAPRAATISCARSLKPA